MYLKFVLGYHEFLRGCVFSLMTQGQHWPSIIVLCCTVVSGASVLHAWTRCSTVVGLFSCCEPASCASGCCQHTRLTQTLSFSNVLFLIQCGLGIQVTQLVRIELNARVNAPGQYVSPSEFLWESIL